MTNQTERGLIACAVYYGKKFDDGVLELYLQHLLGFDPGKVESALWAHQAESEFFPKVSQILKRIKTDRAGDRRGWQIFVEAVVKYAPYESIMFKDAAISRTVKMMALWPRYDFDKYREVEDKKDFFAVYNEFSRNGCENVRLSGLHEISNGMKKFTDPKFQKFSLGKYDAEKTKVVGADGTALPEAESQPLLAPVLDLEDNRGQLLGRAMRRSLKAVESSEGGVA